MDQRRYSFFRENFLPEEAGKILLANLEKRQYCSPQFIDGMRDMIGCGQIITDYYPLVITVASFRSISWYGETSSERKVVFSDSGIIYSEGGMLCEKERYNNQDTVNKFVFFKGAKELKYDATSDVVVRDVFVDDRNNVYFEDNDGKETEITVSKNEAEHRIKTDGSFKTKQLDALKATNESEAKKKMKKKAQEIVDKAENKSGTSFKMDISMTTNYILCPVYSFSMDGHESLIDATSGQITKVDYERTDEYKQRVKNCNKKDLIPKIITVLLVILATIAAAILYVRMSIASGKTLTFALNEMRREEFMYYLAWVVYVLIESVAPILVAGFCWVWIEILSGGIQEKYFKDWESSLEPSEFVEQRTSAKIAYMFYPVWYILLVAIIMGIYSGINLVILKVYG